MSHRRARSVLLVLSLWVHGCARPERAPQDPPIVSVRTAEFSISLPDTLPSGLVHLRLTNEGGYWHHALLIRLDSLQTMEGYLAELRAGKDFPSHATDLGGPALTAPGDTADHVVTLTPGRWLAMCTSTGGGRWHALMGMLTPFVVTSTANEAVEPPASSVTLVMTDEGVLFPDTLPAGPTWVRIENRGRRLHECDVLRLEPGRGIADYRRWQREQKQTTPAPARPVGGCADFGPGVVQWSLMRLEPGEYLMVNDMPGDANRSRGFTVVPRR